MRFPQTACASIVTMYICAATLVFACIIAASRAEYLGCYVDQPSPRELAAGYKDFAVSLTPQVCMTACRDKGYPYAGLQYSPQCFCGDQRPSASDKRPESECSEKCLGDTPENCGGYLRNSVYDSGFSDALITDSRYEYVGCFADQKGRELAEYFQDLGTYNSPEACVSLCEGKGFAYAGLQERTQCLCGNQDPKPEKRVDQQECQTKCPNDIRFNCGAAQKQNVYRTGKSGSNYLGCYFDEHSARRLVSDFKDFGNSLTPQTCIEYCKHKGYLYAGLQSSVQCYCGDLKPSKDDARPETECNSNCSGDQLQICGGSWRNSIYKTDYTEELNADKKYEYIGCFVDQKNPRTLSGDSKQFGETITPEKCITFCKQKNYLYAGIQNRSQCFCGDEHPVPSKQADEQDCKYKCNGDVRFKCGGDWKNSVYRSGNAEGLTIDRRYSYVGCLVDQCYTRAVGGYYMNLGDNSSPENCVSLCKQKGYLYAGIQNRSHCFCSDEHPVPAKHVDELDCKHKCTGDARFICGGDWRNSVYKTGNLEGLKIDRRFEYIGCFIDETKTWALNGDMFTSYLYNTVDGCIAFCNQRGYLYAGLESSVCNYSGVAYIEEEEQHLKTHLILKNYACTCGDEYPGPDKRAYEHECDQQCSGDKNFNCGAYHRVQVYKSGYSEALIIDRRYEYVGCFVDQENSRALGGDSTDFHDTNTPEKCITLCKLKGYLYAGVQNRYKCFCGDEHPVPTKQADKQECKRKCAGDKRFNCGGDYSNSVYKTGYTEGLIVDKTYEYLGCFMDYKQRRTLDGNSINLGDNNSPEKCITFCKQKGYLYAGVQFRSQCFCGDKHPVPANQVDEKECNYKCTGDIRFNCGGAYKNQVYKTGYSEGLIIDKRYEYIGCFEDKISKAFGGDSIDFEETNTPEKCITYCKKMGYLYAGVQKGYKCYCGDENPVPIKQVEDLECTQKCTGDIQFNCGGSYTNNVYKTGYTGGLIIDNKYEYIGCFIDYESDHVLGGDSVHFDDSNSPEKCIAFCKRKGYLYAGVQNKHWCFCGDEDPLPAIQVDDKDCKKKCTGDIRFNCGGHLRNNVYKTGYTDALIIDRRYEYIGCFVNALTSKALVADSIRLQNMNSPAQCITFCKKNGLLYAGVIFRYQCFCVDDHPEPSQQVDEQKCYMKCTGDIRFNCGSYTESGIYKTGNSTIQSNTNVSATLTSVVPPK